MLWLRGVSKTAQALPVSVSHIVTGQGFERYLLVISFPVNHMFPEEEFWVGCIAASGPVWLVQSNTWHFTGLWMQPRSITCLLKGHVRARGLWVSSQVFGMQKSSLAYPPIIFTRLSVGKSRCWSQLVSEGYFGDALSYLDWKMGFLRANLFSE